MLQSARSLFCRRRGKRFGLTRWPSRGVISYLCLVCLLLTACQSGTTEAPTQEHSTPASSSRWLYAEAPFAESSQVCAQAELALQILGSGGPIADDARASSAYLVWYQGAAIALIDAGGGSFQRFGAAGANLEDLALVALSHLHTDHSADLAALMKGAYFSPRSTPLPIFGPDASAPDSSGDTFPSLVEYLAALFAPDRGAYRYLAGLLDGSDGLFALDAHSLAAAPGSQHTFTLTLTHADEPLRDGPAGTEQANKAAILPTLKLQALGVHHGSVPALAYRLELAGHSFVFAGDQSARNPAMVSFAKNADLLVAHVAIPPSARGGALALHRSPQSWGALAETAQVRHLILSHWMQRSLRQRPAVLAAVQENYAGNWLEATDLACIVL